MVLNNLPGFPLGYETPKSSIEDLKFLNKIRKNLLNLLLFKYYFNMELNFTVQFRWQPSEKMKKIQLIRVEKEETKVIGID